MKIEFAAPGFQDATNVSADTSRMINCYRQPLSTGGKTIVPVPGMVFGVEFVDSGYATWDTGGVRSLLVFESIAYAVAAGHLWEFDEDLNLTELGAVDHTEFVTMSGNNGNVCVVSNGRYFVWDGATISEPAAGAFSSFGSVDFLGQCTLLTERSGRRVQWSNPADPTTLDGLNFATTESGDDDNVRGMVFGSEYWIFKRRSIERWYQDAQGAFTALPGATIEKGLKGFRLVCKGDIGGFFIATDNNCYMVNQGGAMAKVSIPAVSQAVTDSEPQNVIYFQDRGNEFYAITFQGRPAWVFNATSQEWFERAEGEDDAWGVQSSCKAYGDEIVGRTTNSLFRLGSGGADATNVSDYGLDYAEIPLIRRIISGNLAFDGNSGRIKSFTVPMRTGFHDVTAMLYTSKDRGNTWSDPKVKTFSTGDYEPQMQWRALGQFRNFCVELRMTDNAFVTVDSQAFLEIA